MVMSYIDMWYAKDSIYTLNGFCIILAFSFSESFQIFISLNFLTYKDYSFIYLYNFISYSMFLINLHNESVSLDFGAGFLMLTIVTSW